VSSEINLLHLLQSITSSIFRYWVYLTRQSPSMFYFCLFLGLTPFTSSLSHSYLFSKHVRTISVCFAVAWRQFMPKISLCYFWSTYSCCVYNERFMLDVLALIIKTVVYLVSRLRCGCLIYWFMDTYKANPVLLEHSQLEIHVLLVYCKNSRLLENCCLFTKFIWHDDHVFVIFSSLMSAKKCLCLSTLSPSLLRLIVLNVFS